MINQTWDYNSAMSVILSKKAVSLGSDVVSKPPSIRPTRLSLKKSANRSIRSNSSSPSKNNPSIPLSSKSSTIYFRTPDGRIIDIPPSKMTEDVLDWDTTRHFTVLTWGEKIILGFVHATRVFSKQWITHILLVLVLLIYTALGGVMFHYVEGSHENRIKINLDDERIKLSRKIWLLRNVTDEAVWYETFFEDIKRYEQEIVSAPTAVTPDRDWDFFGSLFFSGTVYTTIGYGNVVPCTDYGRGLTIVYAFFGIPLLLIILADLGKVLTRAIKFGWSFVRLFYYTGSCRRLRSTGGGALKAVHKLIFKKRANSARESEKPTSAEPSSFVVDDNFDLPVSVALFLLLVYILLGALMIIKWETSWSYFHAVYFIFVSLTTIGFGDMVPDNPTYLIITFIYLLFGLALTSMCINVVQESITNTVVQAKDKIAMHLRRSPSADSIKN